MTKSEVEKCIFCHDIKEEQIVMKSECFKIVFDIDPIQSGHLLIIAKQHRMSLLELCELEVVELIKLQRTLISILEKNGAYGVTIAVNNGKVMDQNTHFHVHLIPRYKDDGFWEKVEVKSSSLNLKKLKNDLLTH